MKNYLITVLFLMMAITASSQTISTLIVGTYTPRDKSAEKETPSAYIVQFDETTGSITVTDSVAAGLNASFIAADRDRKVFYAVNELNGSSPKGEVRAFGYTIPWSNATFMGGCSTLGNDPCHVSVSKKSKLVSVANYSSGNVVFIPTDNRGALLCHQSAEDRHSGSGPHPNQTSPHAHQALASPSGNFIYSCDLGTDQILIYSTKKGGKPQLISSVNTSPGAGPRHLTFHPSHKYAYVINELNGTIECFKVDRKAGSLSHFQTVATSEKTKTDAADIHITSDGKFLYSTNRADLNEIVCFAVDSKTGTLTRNGRYPTNGRGPRNFMISANNKYILIAHQYTNNITVFKVNPSDGSLTDTGNSVKMHSPVCITKL